MKTNQEKIKKINNLGKDFSNQKNWKNNKNNKWYHKNNKNNKWYHKNNKNNKWYHKNNKNNKWYHKNKQKNKKLHLESLFKKFEKYSAAVRKRKILKLTLLGRRAYYAFEEFNKRKKILVFRRPKNIFSVYTSLSLLDPYFYRATREYVAKQTVRRFGFFRWRRYFLRRLIKTRAAYFTHLKKSGGGRWAKKRKYVRYNYKSDLKIIKHQFSKWDIFPN